MNKLLKETKWLRFIQHKSKTKTKVIGVYSTINQHLGTIKWFSNWRHYCFFPNYATLFSDRCLLSIYEFIIKLNEEHKIKLKGSEKR